MIREKAKGPGYQELHYREEPMVYELASAFKAGEPLPWPVLRKEQVHRVWSDFVRDGYVRDEHALDNIFISIRDNVVRLSIATIVAEHTGISPEAILSDVLDKSQYEPFTEWLVDFYGEG